jgi:hypothetical protein
MSSDSDEPYYAISFISYEALAKRTGFQRFVEFLVDSMVALFEARPHWGKVCPLSPAQVVQLYSHLEEFREICRSYDPKGRFRNAWSDALFFFRSQ